MPNTPKSDLTLNPPSGLTLVNKFLPLVNPNNAPRVPPVGIAFITLNTLLNNPVMVLTKAFAVEFALLSSLTNLVNSLRISLILSELIVLIQNCENSFFNACVRPAIDSSYFN